MNNVSVNIVHAYSYFLSIFFKINSSGWDFVNKVYVHF